MFSKVNSNPSFLCKKDNSFNQLLYKFNKNSQNSN